MTIGYAVKHNRLLLGSWDLISLCFQKTRMQCGRYLAVRFR